MADQNDNASVKRSKSLLTRGQRIWLTVSLLLCALLLANSFYLIANRFPSILPGGPAERVINETFIISRLFQVMVLSHTGVGFLAVGMMLIFAIWHLPKVWRRHHPRSVLSGLLFVGVGLVLALTGPFIMYAAASREHAWVWWLHVVAAAVVPAAYVVHRSVSFAGPLRGAYARFSTVCVLAFVAMLIGHGLSNSRYERLLEDRLATSEARNPGPGARARRLADFTDGPYVSPSFVPPESPFFPSAATTTTGDYLPERIITRGDVSSPDRLAADLDKYGFVVREEIGAAMCERCHADSVAQWASSAHRFASFNNPFYEATVVDLRNRATTLTRGVAEHIGAFPHWSGRIGEIKSKWCSGCHDPALMLAGQMTDDVDRRSPQAQAGLTCLACHAIDKIHNQTGNGGYNIADQQDDPYLFAKAGGGSVGAELHDIAIKAKPEVHKRQMLKPFFKEPEFCSACHKVSIQEPVNDYRWLRGQDEYDNWHDSGVSLNASRTFYLPNLKRVCQDCHMPLEPAPLGDLAAKNGMIKSHRFLAVNTALPFVRGDQETIDRTEAFLRDGKLRIDVFALTQESADGKNQTVYALDRVRPPLPVGRNLVVDVVVRNLGVGHTFPGGTTDSNEGWIEFTALDQEGRIIAQSGAIGDDGYVDPQAHFFRSLIVDRHGQPIHRRNAQDIYAPVYVNVIGPGTANVVHYRVPIPDEPGRTLTLRARLLWRKFDRAYTEFAYHANREGFKQFSDVPDLPVTEICSAEVTLPMVERSDRIVTTEEIPAEELAGDWVRFNDYGIGLLLQNDTRGAERAFEQVARLVPERLDGHANLARVLLRDGKLKEAYPHLLACEELDSNNPQTAWFWGVLLQEDGRYVEAASAYRRVLQKFPDDRATWRKLGRTYFLDEKLEQAIEAMQQVLRIDPEDRVAHYHIMLAARALKQTARAQAAEAAYLRYKKDESADEVTKTYRLAHPFDNLESQAIHVHDLTTPLVARSDRSHRSPAPDGSGSAARPGEGGVR